MLKGKTAIVTGGSRGIGAAICKKFAEQGANIALLYAGNTQKAEETKAALQEMGVKAEAYQCNVADAEQVAAVCKQIIKDFGGADILVNNAGITKDKLVPMMKVPDFDSGYQSERRFLYDQAALPCFHETEKRQDYQYQLCIRSDGQSRSDKLLRIQSGAYWADKIRCKRTG